MIQHLLGSPTKQSCETSISFQILSKCSSIAWLSSLV